MGFEVLETETKEKHAADGEDQLYAPDREKAGEAKPNLMVSIPTTLIGMSKSKRFELLKGSGADAGKIRIKGTAVAKKGVEPKQLKNAFVFNFGAIPKNDCIFDGERRVVKKLTDEEYEIDVGKLLDPDE